MIVTWTKWGLQYGKFWSNGNPYRRFDRCRTLANSHERWVLHAARMRYQGPPASVCTNIIKQFDEYCTSCGVVRYGGTRRMGFTGTQEGKIVNDRRLCSERWQWKVIRHLGVRGECNIQYALDPHSKEFRIIEVLLNAALLTSKFYEIPCSSAELI